MVVFTEPGPWQPGDAETAIVAARLLHRVWQHVWTPSFAVVVLTGPRFGVLTESDRESIWRRWGVPVYEFLTNHAGQAIARECDAHEGLHVYADAAWAGPVEDRECGCGVCGPMITAGVPVAVAAA
jgi:hypothetical protein